MVKALSPDLGAMTEPKAAREPEAKDKPALTLAELEATNRQHDWILAGLTVLLAFLLASFPVLNSDIWLQLRTGQMITSGEFGFGVDPYTYVAPELWVHTAWLWDVLVYGVYSLGGGPGLVLLRGLLVLGLAVLLFQMRRPEVSLFPIVLSLALAFVVMSGRIFLRSEFISVIFMGLTLYLLWRPAARSHLPLLGKAMSWTQHRAWVFLPVLFALWANCDHWFFLGPALVLLFLVGDVMQGVFTGWTPREEGLDAAERKSLGLVFIVGLLACCLNPYTVRIFFQWPGDSSSEALDLVLLNQPALRTGVMRPLLSPFSPDYFQSSLRDVMWWRPLGLTLAEWAYYPLAALGLISFALSWREVKVWRLFVWGAFFALSAWQARNAAFFAVAAGPIMGLNFQDWLALRTAGRTTYSRPGLVVGQLGRILVLGSLIALCFLMTVRMSSASLRFRGRDTALGLIHTRALGWSMLEDPSLQRSSEQLLQWQLPGNGFSLEWREQPSYQAYFAPGQKTFMDSRFLVHGKRAAEFYAIANALKETNPGRLDKRATHHHYQWQDAFRKHDISHLIVRGDADVARPDPSVPGGTRYVPVVDLLLFDEIETTDPTGNRERKKVWDMLGYVDGRTFILAWTGSPHYERLKALRFEPEKEAFHEPTRVPPPNGPRGTEMVSPLVTWLAGELDRPPTAIDEANWLLENSARTYGMSQRQAIIASFQLLNVAPANSMPGVGIVSPPLLIMEPLSVAPHQLAIRAARRAIAERPDYYGAYHQLFQAYADAYGMEREISPPIAVREAQIAAALREAVRLRPQEPLLQLELALLYLRKGLSDLAVKHFEDAFRAAESLGLERKSFMETLQRMPEVAHLQPLFMAIGQEQQVVANRRASFNARAVLTSDPGEKARYAMQLQLTDEARQAMEAVVAQLQLKPQLQTGDLAIHQLLDLYLQIGYLPEALRLLSRPDTPGRLGPAAFHQRAALARAAAGDYAGSLRHFMEFDKVLARSALDRAILGVGLQTRGAQSDYPGSTLHGLNQLYEAQNLNAQRAEVLFQAGLLALEAGWTKPSSEHPDAPQFLRTALVDLDPDFAQAILAKRYYRLMTNRWPEFPSE